MKGIVSQEHADQVCKKGQGAETCRFLILATGGWTCGKADAGRFFSIIEHQDSMRAQGNHCPGIDTDPMVAVIT